MGCNTSQLLQPPSVVELMRNDFIHDMCTTNTKGQTHWISKKYKLLSSEEASLIAPDVVRHFPEGCHELVSWERDPLNRTIVFRIDYKELRELCRESFTLPPPTRHNRHQVSQLVAALVRDLFLTCVMDIRSHSLEASSETLNKSRNLRELMPPSAFRWLKGMTLGAVYTELRRWFPELSINLTTCTRCLHTEVLYLPPSIAAATYAPGWEPTPKVVCKTGCACSHYGASAVASVEEFLVVEIMR